LLVRHADDPEPMIAEGTGTASSSTSRAARRLRLRPALPRSALRADRRRDAARAEERVSHRGQAMRILLERLRARPLG
jgi:hypothetical protein